MTDAKERSNLISLLKSILPSKENINFFEKTVGSLPNNATMLDFNNAYIADIRKLNMRISYAGKPFVKSYLNSHIRGNKLPRGSHFDKFRGRE